MLLWVGGVFRIWSRPLLQGSGLLSVDKRDSEPGPAVCIGASSVRRSGNHCAAFGLHTIVVIIALAHGVLHTLEPT